MGSRTIEEYRTLEEATTRHALELSHFIGATTCALVTTDALVTHKRTKPFAIGPYFSASFHKKKRAGSHWEVPDMDSPTDTLRVRSMGYVQPNSIRQTTNVGTAVLRVRIPESNQGSECRVTEGRIGNFYKLIRIRGPEKYAGSGATEAHVSRLLAARAVAEAVEKVVAATLPAPPLPELPLLDAGITLNLIEGWHDIDSTGVLLAGVRAVKYGVPSTVLTDSIRRLDI